MNETKKMLQAIENQYRISNMKIREQQKKKNQTTLKGIATSEGFIAFAILSLIMTIISCIGL